MTCCWYNQMAETGSFFPRSIGQIRMFCNGALDEIEDYMLEKGE